MNLSANNEQPLHWLQRVLYGTAAALCLLLGVIGLILPVIPGIVFLALGGVLLGKASTRLARRLKWPGSGNSEHYFRASKSLHLTDKLRLGGWLLARSIIRAVQGLLRTVASKPMR